jgi:hypothetical protein
VKGEQSVTFDIAAGGNGSSFLAVGKALEIKMLAFYYFVRHCTFSSSPLTSTSNLLKEIK